ncbi:hypothetical protein SAY86_001013 [Trapa natans]|uniref:Proline-rich protein n=1 Tax=Trapa natans TaxID=22666 RepID=A0AAN7MVD5_TRANT|nr:hypothetical protein SAY86_001013 [Trapa natans]
MRILAAALCLQLLYLSSYCYGEDKTVAPVVEVVGSSECSECHKANVEPSKAFQGLRVTIDCKTASGEINRRGVGGLDKQGKFKVALGHDLVQDGNLKEECYAQLHSASSEPCPVLDTFDSTKVVFRSTEQGKHTFGLAGGKLKFSPETCNAAFFLPYFKHPPLPSFPPFPKGHPWFKPLPKDHPWFKHFTFPPLPLPPPVPGYQPPVIKKPPVYKPPVYKPPVIHKPPVVKKPCPPPTPIHKAPPLPPVPVYKPPPVIKKPPLYKPPVIKKPPVYKPPIIKKPCPPPKHEAPVLPPPVPVYKPPIMKKPCPPPTPKHEAPVPPPPVPVYKPPVIKKPCPPIFKVPLPPPIPVYKKPLPPLPPVYLPPPVPIYKPLPPLPKFPPLYKPPCPPLPEHPYLPKLPPYPPHHP